MSRPNSGYEKRRPRGPSIRLPLIFIAMIATLATGQESQPSPPRLNLPNGPVTRLASPDGSRVLYGVPYQKGVDESPQLWIEDTRTHQRKMLLTISGTVSAAWSPHGSAFAVEDHSASDSAQTYIYDAGTLHRRSLGGEILAADPGVERFAKGHAYFDLERWDPAGSAIIHFHGHTDQALVVCFDFRYRVGGGGAVEKLSERVSPLNGNQPCR